jgi:hypothetical protein
LRLDTRRVGALPAGLLTCEKNPGAVILLVHSETSSGLWDKGIDPAVAKFPPEQTKDLLHDLHIRIKL